MRDDFSYVVIDTSLVLMRQETWEDDPDCDLFQIFDNDEVLPAEYLEEYLNGWDPYSGQYIDDDEEVFDYDV